MASKKSTKRAPRKAEISAQYSAKRKGKPRGKPFDADNPFRFKSKEELGGALDPKINAGGKPGATIMSAAYKEWLATVNENDPQKRTNAQIGASAIGLEMIKGDVSAAREIRAATEGDKITLATWQLEIVEALKAGRLTAQQVVDNLEIEDARICILAAGQTVVPSPSERESAASDSPTAA